MEAENGLIKTSATSSAAPLEANCGIGTVSSMSTLEEARWIDSIDLGGASL